MRGDKVVRFERATTATGLILVSSHAPTCSVIARELHVTVLDPASASSPSTPPRAGRATRSRPRSPPADRCVREVAEVHRRRTTVSPLSQSILAYADAGRPRCQGRAWSRRPTRTPSRRFAARETRACSCARQPKRGAADESSSLRTRKIDRPGLQPDRSSPRYAGAIRRNAASIDWLLDCSRAGHAIPTSHEALDAAGRPRLPLRRSLYGCRRV